MSVQSKEFVKSLLVVDPEDRMGADEALGAVWLNRRMTATVRNPHAEEFESATNSIIRYSKYSKLKKMALMVVAHRSSSGQIGILRKVFQKYDTKKDGQLSIEEFKAALHDAGYPEDKCEEIFHSVVCVFSARVKSISLYRYFVGPHTCLSLLLFSIKNKNVSLHRIWMVRVVFAIRNF